MSAESARVNAAQEEWFATYGFTHDCRCDKDYATDNTGTVTECWAGMAEDALATCKQQRKILAQIASGECPDPVALAQEYVLG